MGSQIGLAFLNANSNIRLKLTVFIKNYFILEGFRQFKSLLFCIKVKHENKKFIFFMK
jgi:hypothetical protein